MANVPNPASNNLAAKLATANGDAWLRLGSLGELMNDLDKALYCYENTLRHNPFNIKALTQIASVYRTREQYPKAVEYFQRILNIEGTNGEIWGALGHCYLMMDELQKAYTAYQQALYHLPNPKDPNLWYGIGILYDRYGSFDHAEEAFTAVLKMDAKFEKANEIYFRLGIIYKQQQKYEQSLKCFKFILNNPPRPLVQGDIYFQIGHVYELKKEFHAAKDAYERVLKDNPNHAKVLQQVGWLYHHNTSFGNQDMAITYLMRSIDADPTDGQTWYLLGRCYMTQQKYRKAYDAYQQAVYRDGRNPTFWCSIGVLYYQINQYRDALDAYSRAIRLNPYLSEVWYDLGTLYESCNQISDSLDAYQRAAELDPSNKHIQQRLSMLRGQHNGDGPAKPKQVPAKEGMKEGKEMSIPSFSNLVGSDDAAAAAGAPPGGPGPGPGPVGPSDKIDFAPLPMDRSGGQGNGLGPAAMGLNMLGMGLPMGGSSLNSAPSSSAASTSNGGAGGDHHPEPSGTSSAAAASSVAGSPSSSSAASSPASSASAPPAASASSSSSSSSSTTSSSSASSSSSSASSSASSASTKEPMDEGEEPGGLEIEEENGDEEPMERSSVEKTKGSPGGKKKNSISKN